MTEGSDWIRIDSAQQDIDVLLVRARRDGERWVVTDVHVRGERLTADTLRRGLSLPRIEARLNNPDTVDRARLGRPDRSDPARFYGQVAAAYRQFVVETRAPAKAIAAEAQVPVSTAHRWLREARLRGLLPPGHKGRAG